MSTMCPRYARACGTRTDRFLIPVSSNEFTYPSFIFFNFGILILIEGSLMFGRGGGCLRSRPGVDSASSRAGSSWRSYDRPKSEAFHAVLCPAALCPRTQLRAERSNITERKKNQRTGWFTVCEFPGESSVSSQRRLSSNVTGFDVGDISGEFRSARSPFFFVLYLPRFTAGDVAGILVPRKVRRMRGGMS